MSALPVGWRRGNIRRFATMKTGHTPSRSVPEYWEDTTIPWFTLADVWQLRDGGQVFLGETANRISELGLANSAAELLPARTVVLSRTASVGFSGIMPEAMATSQDFWNWVCGPELVPEYLNYQFKAIAQDLRGLNMGSTHQTIYQKDAAGIEILVPPLDEQRAIADFLDRETAQIDRLIAEQQHLIELLRERRQAVIDKAIESVRSPKVQLRRAIEFLTSGSRGWGDFYADEGDRFVRIGNLPRTTLALSGEVQYVALPSEVTEGERTRLRANDLLFSITAYLGSVAVVDEEWVDAYVSQHVALCRVDQSQLDSRFVGFVMLSTDGQNQLKEGAAGGTKQQLALDDIRGLIVPFPPLDEQKAVAAYLYEQTAKTDSLISESKRFIELAQERRSALITAAVTGQLDVRSVA